MKLSVKVLLIILVSWSLMLGATYVASEQVLLNNYIKLENENASRNVVRATEAIDKLVSSLNDLLLSYAVWDESHLFMEDNAIKNKSPMIQNRIKAYIDGNLSSSVLDSTGLAMVMYYDQSGKPIHLTALSDDKSHLTPLPKDFDEAFQDKGSLRSLVHFPSKNDYKSGLFLISKGIILLADQPIVKSDGSGPSNGSILMVKYFTNEDLKKVSSITELDLALSPMDTPIYEELLKANQPLIQLDNEDYLSGYTLLKDINGKPIAILKVTMPRTIYHAGEKTLGYFYTMFFISCALFTLLLFYLIRFLIIRKLFQMNKMIAEVGNTQNFSLRLKNKGNDELSVVGNEVNQMLSNIQFYDNEKKALLSQLTDELEKVNDFSKKLEIAEKFLASVINFMPSILIITDNTLKIKKINYIAEKEMGFLSDEVKGKSLVDCFVYLKPHESELQSAIQKNRICKIEKIDVPEKENYHYFSVMVYPLTYQGGQFLVIRIDNITEQIRFRERLVQHDKLASIGVLTAGVAHEINNPVNFLSAAVLPLKNDLTTIIDIIKKYETIKTDEGISEKLNEVNQLKDENELDYVIKEAEELIGGIKEGAARTAEIVSNLRSFSKFDEGVAKSEDIHAGIDSTLNLLHHKYKNRIIIHKEYGNIPLITCYLGKLNQVFMNVLSNAVDAIADKGEIRIRTTQPDDKHVMVSIKDNGSGISKENLNRIFEPFFTTKGAGQGVGLGLSISVGIIQEHHGRIEVKSEIGQGTEFVITLPVNSEAYET